MVELIVSIVCLLLILYMGRMGAAFGMFFEMTSAVLLFFAMLASLRYWYPFSQWFGSVAPISGAYATFVSYWVLFLLGSIPLMVVLKFVNEDSRPKYPTVLDNLLGFLFSATSGAIVICAVMTSLSVIVPKVWEPYERTALLVPLDTVPISVYQAIERGWFGIAEKDPTHTRLPTFEKADADNAEKYWR
jgi:uncharacterized membrane protein required for colicin V production